MGIEKFGHVSNAEEGPGSTWKPETDETSIIDAHSTSIGDILSPEHYDVFIRYGYADSLVKGLMGAEYDFWKKFYENMQDRRVGHHDTEAFDQLIRKFEKPEFVDSMDPIPVDENYELLDGSHRTACFALFDKRPKVDIFNKKSHTYNREWFVDQGFSDEELSQVDQIAGLLMDKYSKVDKDSSIAIIWGVALEHWERIVTNLHETNIRRSFIRDFGDTIQNFIKEAYINDGMIADRIRKKAEKLSAKSTKAGIIITEGSPEEMAEIKKQIREELRVLIEDYFFDCVIHVLDEDESNINFFNKYDVKK